MFMGDEAAALDLDALNQRVAEIILRFPEKYTHTEMSEAIDRFDLPKVVDGTKRERIQACIELMEVAQLPEIAERILASNDLTSQERFDLQEAVWVDDPEYPPIVRRVRHNIARTLPIEDLYVSADEFMRLLGDLWVIDNEPFASIDQMFGFDAGMGRGLRAQIERHVIRNQGDWSTEELFEQIGAFDASDRRFVRFLEGLASSRLLPDEAAQRRYVENVNEHLTTVGAELQEYAVDGGYPVFRMTFIGRSCAGQRT